MNVSVSGEHAASVFDILKKRIASGSRADGHRLGLVVEGGGMRGVCTAGSLLGLHALGAARAFDDVFATSAGAMNAAYFLTGRGDSSADGYYRVLADGRFYNPLRPWKVVDVDFVIDQMLVRLRPLDVASVLRSQTRFWIAVADFRTAESRMLRAGADDLPLLQLLKAAIALPVYYNRVVALGDLLAFDAGLCNPLPVADALRAGCSHVLVLTSRPEPYTAEPPALWQKWLFELTFARGNSALSGMLARSWQVSNALRAQAMGRPRLSAPNLAIATISPTDNGLHETTQDVPLLRDTLFDMARSTLGVFDHTPELLNEWRASQRI